MVSLSIWVQITPVTCENQTRFFRTVKSGGCYSAVISEKLLHDLLPSRGKETKQQKSGHYPGSDNIENIKSALVSWEYRTTSRARSRQNREANNRVVREIILDLLASLMLSWVGHLFNMWKRLTFQNCVIEESETLSADRPKIKLPTDASTVCELKDSLHLTEPRIPHL